MRTESSILTEAIHGSRFDSDLIVRSLGDIGPLIDRNKLQNTLHYDLAGFIILATGSTTRRLLFSEDIKYPTVFNLKKTSLINNLKRMIRFDSEMWPLYQNGIPTNNYIYSDNKPTSLSHEQVVSVIDHYDITDETEKSELIWMLAHNGVYKIPNLRHLDYRYHDFGNMRVNRDEVIERVIAEGWFNSKQVFRKQKIILAN